MYEYVTSLEMETEGFAFKATETINNCDCYLVHLSTFPYLGLDDVCLLQNSKSRSEL